MYKSNRSTHFHLNEDLCARSRYYWQGQVITSHIICGVSLHVPALDTPSWHKSPHSKTNICRYFRFTISCRHSIFKILQNICRPKYGTGHGDLNRMKTCTYLQGDIITWTPSPLMTLCVGNLPVDSQQKGQQCRALVVSLLSAWTSCCTNSGPTVIWDASKRVWRHWNINHTA